MTSLKPCSKTSFSSPLFSRVLWYHKVVCSIIQASTDTSIPTKTDISEGQFRFAVVSSILSTARRANLTSTPTVGSLPYSYCYEHINHIGPSSHELDGLVYSSTAFRISLIGGGQHLLGPLCIDVQASEEEDIRWWYQIYLIQTPQNSITLLSSNTY